MTWQKDASQMVLGLNHGAGKRFFITNEQLSCCGNCTRNECELNYVVIVPCELCVADVPLFLIKAVLTRTW